MIDTDDLDLQRLVEEPSYFVEKIIGVQPFSYQKGFMDEDHDRKQFVAGRQVGKSRTCAWIALHKAITREGAMVLITAKSRRQATELFNQIKEELRIAESNNSLTETDFGITRDTRTEINFDNGSRIKVVPIGNDGSNIRTYSADVIIVDEAAFIDEQVFQEVLTPMLAVTDGDFVIISTPYGKQGFFWKKKNDDDWYTQQVSSWDNPKIDDDFIDKQREQLTSLQFKQEIRGEFDEETNSAFPSRDVLSCMSPTVTENKDAQKYLSVDPARHGGDLSAYLMMDSHGNVYDLDSTEDLPLTDSIGRTKHYDNIHHFDEIIVDATGLGGGVVDQLKQDMGNDRIQEFQFNSVKKKQNVYNKLITAIERADITLPDKDNGKQEELLYRHLTSVKKEYTTSSYAKFHAEDGSHDDFADALVLANHLRTQDSIGKRKPDDGAKTPVNLGTLR